MPSICHASALDTQPAPTPPSPGEVTAPSLLSPFPDINALQGAKSAGSGEISPATFQQAKSSYERGVAAAVESRDYTAAFFYFNQAFSYRKLPHFLFSMAECQKTIGHDIEALFLFADMRALNNSTAPEERLDARFDQASKSSIDSLLKRFVAVKFIRPEGLQLSEIKADGFSLVETDLGGHLAQKRFFAGVSPAGNLDRAVVFPKEFIFLVKPGNHRFEFIADTGRSYYLNNVSVRAPLSTLKINPNNWPSTLMIENVQPGMRVSLEGPQQQTILDRKFSQRKRNLVLQGLKPGSYDLLVTRNRFKNVVSTHNFAGGQREQVTLDMEPMPVARRWQFWLGVGVVAGVAIAATAVGLSIGLHPEKPATGSGAVTVDMTAD